MDLPLLIVAVACDAVVTACTNENKCVINDMIYHWKIIKGFKLTTLKQF